VFCAAGIQVQRACFAEKGVVFDGAPAHTPMLSALKIVSARISYQALYISFTAFESIATGDESGCTGVRALVTPYLCDSIRRTGYVRYLARENGQCDPQVRERYYWAQMERGRAKVEKVFEARDEWRLDYRLVPSSYI
jgi:hypothetical protein